MSSDKQQTDIETAERLDLRVGRIVEASVSERAKPPALKLVIDFGPLGIKKSSARITDLYAPEQLIDKQIVALVNVAPRQVASVISECLVLGVVCRDGKVVLLAPELGAEPGDIVK
jgi:tRNA-binding protein